MKTKSKITLQSILEAGHAPEQAPHVLALCRHLDCGPDGVSAERYDHYGLATYETPQGTYAIGTDEEATQAAIANIRDSVWAFNASFILSECGLPAELEDAITAFQQEKCESANDALLALVEKCCNADQGQCGSVTNGLEAFAESAIQAYGRGHFLSSYDSEENEMELLLSDATEEEKTAFYEASNGSERLTFYLYRTN